MTTVIPPLVVELEVAATGQRAFDTWVEQAHVWWPKGHTMSGDPEAIVFEPEPGGRIYERAHDGQELVWGEVVTWEPPHRLRCRWHLFFSPEEATDLDITFEDNGDHTLVRLTQTGWEALGEQGPIRRERTVGGWAATTAGYVERLARAA